jgi:protein-tyrosine phosphatase
MLPRGCFSAQEFGMIDIHNHLLYAIDDGPKEREETLEMCRIACEDGIRAIVATPHSFDGRFAPRPELIKAFVAELNEDLAANGIEVKVMPGMEVRMTAGLWEHVSRDILLPLNGGRYVLLEFHPLHVPVGFENLVDRFVESGLRLILAHPEKNLLIQKNPSYLFKLLRRCKPWTLLTQVTADSLIGRSGFWAARTAKLLIKCGLAHVIATDAHSAEHRPPRLSPAVAKAAKIMGEEKARRMVHDIPEAVLEGKDFPDAWEPTEPRRWWRIL